MQLAASARHALTLLELLIVLVILTIVATVAVSSLAPRVETARFEQTRTLLNEIEVATAGPRRARQVDGTPLLSGFVADVGRLPVASAAPNAALSPAQGSNAANPISTERSNESAKHVLGELYDLNCSLARQFPFRFRQGPQTPIDFSDIQLPCGWRGPYLQLPGGRQQGIVDAWGKPFEFRLASTGEVESVRWLPQASLDRGIEQSLVSGRVKVTGSLNSDQPLPPNISVKLLVPDPNSSLSELVVLSDENDSADAFEFSQVPIGLRAICVMQGEQRIITRYLQVPHDGLSLVVDLTDKLGGIDE